MSNNIQIQRFTTDNVIETTKLQSMSKKKLIKHIEQLEQHALHLDYGLEVLLENLQSVKKAQQNQPTMEVPEENKVHK